MVDDRDALKQLKSVSKAGVPHRFQHYLYVPSESVGKEVARQLQDQGFEVEHRRGADGVHWLVLAKVEMIPSEDLVLQTREFLEAVAGEKGGEYDGWEAEVRGS